MSPANKPFCLLSAPNSGANFVLAKLLDTKKVLVGWAPFNAKSFGGFDDLPHFDIPRTTLAMMNDASWRDEDSEVYLEHALGLNGALDDTGVEAIGFKIYREHDSARYFRYSFDRRFKQIILRRKSVLAAYAETKLKSETNAWLKHRGAHRAPINVVFDAGEFEEFRALYNGNFASILDNIYESGMEHFDIFYEDLVSCDDAFPSLCEFIGIGRMGTEARLRPDDPAVVLSQFVNPEAAVSVFEVEQRQ